MTQLSWPELLTALKIAATNGSRKALNDLTDSLSFTEVSSWTPAVEAAANILRKEGVTTTRDLDSLPSKKWNEIITRIDEAVIEKRSRNHRK